MEKIKSVIGAVAGRLRSLGVRLQERFPAASAKVKVVSSRLVDFCKARPKVAVSMAAVILLILIVGSCSRHKGDDAAGEEGLAYIVQRGPLTISVVASGNIENREKVIVRNKVEGARATILFLIEEGSQVKAGDLLVELDSGDFEDQELDAKVEVDNGKSDVVRATETLAITKNQAEADIEKGDLALKFAKLALQKYDEGDYPQSLQKAKTDITIAEEELSRSEERLTWSEKLSEEEFITRSEYQADELAMRKQKIELEMAKNRLEVLEKYTHLVEQEKLKSDVTQADLAIDRVRRKAKADILKAEVDLSAKDVELARATEKLERIRERIKNCRITAPVDGLVVYATSVGSGSWRHRSEPLAEGQVVEGKQELIYLPTTGAMNVPFDVQEGSLSKINKGTPAIITVDALPGREFSGVVKKIAVLPDTTQSWLNPDLKVYNCEIEITSSTEGLRPGMSCGVEVLYQQLNNVLFVPIQSVVTVDNKPTVFKKGFGGAKPQPVETGLDNNRMVHIISGLEEGDEVLLSPPLREAEKGESRSEAKVAVEPTAQPSPVQEAPKASQDKPNPEKPNAERPARREGQGPRKSGGERKKPGTEQ